MVYRKGARTAFTGPAPVVADYTSGAGGNDAVADAAEELATWVSKACRPAVVWVEDWGDLPNVRDVHFVVVGVFSDKSAAQDEEDGSVSSVHSASFAIFRSLANHYATDEMGWSVPFLASTNAAGFEAYGVDVPHLPAVLLLKDPTCFEDEEGRVRPRAAWTV